MRVLQASSAGEAIHIVLKFSSRVDLLLTDIEMPGMNGMELAKEVVALKRGIRIVYMSAGMTEEEWRESERVQSGSFFLQKPFRSQVLGVFVQPRT